MKTTKLPILRSLALTAMLAATTPAGADVISDWNDIGFHFRSSSVVGAERGRLIAQHALRNFLLPVPSAVSGQAQASGAFQLNLLTVGARPYVIETSSDLVGWAPWKTNLTGLVSEVDPSATNSSRKFYRALPK